MYYLYGIPGFEVAGGLCKESASRTLAAVGCILKSWVFYMCLYYLYGTLNLNLASRHESLGQFHGNSQFAGGLSLGLPAGQCVKIVLQLQYCGDYEY